jgi:hypothetical protein
MLQWIVSQEAQSKYSFAQVRSEFSDRMNLSCLVKLLTRQHDC